MVRGRRHSFLLWEKSLYCILTWSQIRRLLGAKKKLNYFVKFEIPICYIGRFYNCLLNCHSHLGIG